MSARERFAWLWLGTLVVAYAAYFTALGLIGDTLTFGGRVALFGACAAAQMLALGIGGLILRRRRDELPVDERDRAIEHRALAAAYRVLMAGMIVVGGLMPFDARTGMDVWTTFNAAVLAIVLAELTHQLLVVRAYRRG
ncbi:MAG: hypothetical protein ACOY4K_05085 [Pseudomonadota bacterium]